jgi:hypothetical protein
MMERDEGAAIARFGVPLCEEHLAEIRRMLKVETQLESASDDASDTLVMKELCFLLFTARQVEDSLLVWEAKAASFDAGCSIDVQLLCGAGFAETVGYLRSVDSKQARDASIGMRMRASKATRPPRCR